MNRAERRRSQKKGDKLQQWPCYIANGNSERFEYHGFYISYRHSLKIFYPVLCQRTRLNDGSKRRQVWIWMSSQDPND